MKCLDEELTSHIVIALERRKALISAMPICKFQYYSAHFIRYYLLGFPAILVDLGGRYFLPSKLINGIHVIDPISETQKEFARLVETALTLIADLDKRRFKRVQREIHVIVNSATSTCIAKYCRPLKVCNIDIRYFFDGDPTITAKLLASALIHEATHGSLFSAQVVQNGTNHVRVERLCCKEATRFLSRVGITKSVWDLYEEKDLKPMPLRARLRLLRKDIHEVRTRDFASEAAIWKNVNLNNKAEGRADKT